MAENKYEELWAELKKYLTLQIDYAKLTAVEKLVVLLSAIAMVAVMRAVLPLVCRGIHVE